MSDPDQIQRDKKTILSATWAAKASTKYEIYLLLCTECKAYLPRIEHITVYFLKEIISGKKKALKQNDVQHLFVPQYEGKLLFYHDNFSSRPWSQGNFRADRQQWCSADLLPRPNQRKSQVTKSLDLQRPQLYHQR